MMYILMEIRHVTLSDCLMFNHEFIEEYEKTMYITLCCFFYARYVYGSMFRR